MNYKIYKTIELVFKNLWYCIGGLFSILIAIPTTFISDTVFNTLIDHANTRVEKMKKTNNQIEELWF